jgi:hypothetical protein
MDTDKIDTNKSIYNLTDCYNVTLNITRCPIDVGGPVAVGGTLASILLVVVVSVVLGGLIIGTIVGNACVILSVVVYDKMRTLSNGLIASLASADLLVAIVVLPISLQVLFSL